MPSTKTNSLNNLPNYCSRLPKFISDSRGKAPKQESIASHSNFNKPIEVRSDRGNSRIWADASDEVKLKSVNQILDDAFKYKMNIQEAIYALSVGYIESGFNPDAAAATSSASGLGQFINQTGEHYGLNEINRFDIDANSEALVKHSLNNLKLSKNKKIDPFIQSYAHHHDGPNVTTKTLKLSKSKIPSLMQQFGAYLTSKDCFGY